MTIARYAAITCVSMIAIINIVVRAIVDTPVASPSNPSIKLIAFVIPTTHKIVIKTLNGPSSINPIKGNVIRSIMRPEEIKNVAAIIWPTNFTVARIS